MNYPVTRLGKQQYICEKMSLLTFLAALRIKGTTHKQSTLQAM